MKKLENYSQLDGTSFHGDTIETTPNTLIKLSKSVEAEYFADNTGEDKTNFVFEFLTDDGIPFSVYDWKEYRQLGFDEVVTFHIGTHTGSDSKSAVKALKQILNRK